jgi:tetratricopeptide (TPR) repeat protein
MESIEGILGRVRQFIKDYKHLDAEPLLRESIEAHPKNPDLQAELALLLCLTQREFEAVALLDKAMGAARYSELVDTLQKYFHCRSLLAKKIGVEDDKIRPLAPKLHQHGIGPATGVGIKLSACLIVKNEEAHLARCLSSLKDVVDEIVVVDTGSTDRTIEIAESFGAVIGHFAWCDDFAAARNESLRLATGDWALWIDADEELDAKSVNAIREGLIRPQFGGYFIQIINFMEAENSANQYVHSPVRLFQLVPGVEFAGRIHEQVLPSLHELGLPCATLSKAKINHYGYQAETMLEKNKLERTISMLEREVHEHPEDPFHWFNLANAYSVGRMPEKAEPAARESVVRLEPGVPYGPVAYQLLSSSLIALGRPEEALEVCAEAEAKGFDSILNKFDQAHALFKLERFQEALSHIDSCLAMDWPHDLTGDYGIKTHKGLVLKAQILCGAGRLNEAMETVETALGVDPTFAVGQFAKASILEAAGQLEEAAALYCKCAVAPGLEAAIQLAGRCWTNLKEFAKAGALFRQAFEDNPEDLNAWSCWAACAEAAGDPAEMLTAYRMLGDRPETAADILVNCGRALAQLGEVDSALEHFGRAIDKEPTNSNAYFNCGDVLYRLERFEEAATLYEAGLRYDSQNPQAWFVLGNALAQLGSSDGAKIAYNQTLAMQPDHYEARNNLAIVQTAA